MVIRTFEECLPEIEKVVETRRSDWTFKASVMEDFDDIKSRIITHIWKKWDHYDQSRPLGAWVTSVMKNQTINILRDTYLSTSSPCSRCACNLGEGMCSFYGEQGNDCPLYRKWSLTKKQQHMARLPLPLENHSEEVHSMPDQTADLDAAASNLHKRMSEELTKSEWAVYEAVFILHKEDVEVAREMGFKSDNGKKVGTKRVRQIKVLALKKAKEIIETYGLEFTPIN